MGSPVIFQGSFAKFLTSELNLMDQAYVLTGTTDPSSVATDAPQGSLYLRVGGSGGAAYLKQDNGSTTNWTLIPLGAGSYVVPTFQSFLTGSGTYTPPNSVLYVRAIIVGPGGGGSGGGSGGGDGSAGADTTIGSTIIVGGHGGPALASGSIGGGGGTASITAGSGVVSVWTQNGSIGASGGQTGTTPDSLVGGTGGSSHLGGQGTGTLAPTAGNNGIANTGGGGAGGGSASIAVNVGAGGGGGGYAEAIISGATLTTWKASGVAYSIGGGGGGGTGGTASGAGGSGGSGVAIFEEYYQ